MSQRDGDGRPSHVRFAEREEVIRHNRRPHRQDSRGYTRRGTYESVDSPADERPRYRRDSGDRPNPRAPIYPESWTARLEEHATLEPITTQDLARGAIRRPFPRTTAAALPADEVRLTESPPPIEDEWDDRRNRTRNRASYNEVEVDPYPDRRSRRFDRPRSKSRSKSRSRSHSRSRSRSPHYSRFETPVIIREDSRHSRYPSYPVDRYSVERPYRPPSVSSDDGDPYDKFDFSLPSQSITESSKDGDSDTESPESDDRAPPKDERGKLKTTPAMAVKASVYTGNAELGGSHGANLTVVHGTNDRKQSLFRWLHVRQEIMNFEDLWVEISCVSGLSDLEKRAVTRLRADVKSSLKSRYNPKGEKVGYIDPRSIEVPLKSLLNKNVTREPPTGSARWICMPYFSLEQYSGLLSASNLSSFPAQTLLQAQFSRNTLQRDMEQAVCQLGNAKRGECFHISQLWCIVIDNSLLVTCGTMTQSDLQGEALKVHDEPSRDLATGNQGKILVSYGESVTWSLAAEECQTWFAFISKFQAFWPKNLEFWHKDQMVTAVKWPKILRLVSHVRSSIKIMMKIGCLPDAPRRAILNPEPQSETASNDEERKMDVDEFVHVMTLLPGDRKRTSTFAEKTAVKTQLDAAHKFLMWDTSYSNRRAYESCEPSTMKECREYLSSLASEVEDDGTDEVRRAYEEKIDVFNAAEMLHRFFLPRNTDDPTSGKFWGAFRKLLQLKALESNHTRAFIDNTVSEIRTFLRSFTPILIAFQNVLSHASEEERAAIELPREFVTAWLYAVMAMVYGSQDNHAWYFRTSRLRDLTELGMKKLMHWLPDKSLLKRTSLLPLEVLSLVTLGLLQDQVGKSDDICETYSQYLNSLENSIMSKQSDRSYQHRIDLVQQEMSAIKRTLWKQRSIISNIRNSLTALDTHNIVVLQGREESAMRRDRYADREREREREQARYADVPPPPPTLHTSRVALEHSAPVRPANDYMGLDDEFIREIAVASKLSSTDAGGLRGLFFMECSRLIEQREFEFRRYAEYASDLERAINYKMNFAKDRQENAIFAFTLVTIVFLPMSAVSSIFGMNTTDVRDMESSQWLYWAVALPLTLFVIGAGLWWMGELGNIARWLMRKPRQTSQGVYGGPAMISQAVDQTYYPSISPPGAVMMDYGPPPYAPSPGVNRVWTQGHYAPPRSVWQGRPGSVG